jgi:hypothetical protein
MRLISIAAIGAAVWLAAGSTASAEVQLTIQNGRVSLVAKDATVRQILTEWGRVGRTKIVNVERLAGPPVTLQLTNVSEKEALDVLLRTFSGYLAAPRPTHIPTLSAFDRIIVMPTSAAPQNAAAPSTPLPAPAAAFRPAPFQQPAALPEEVSGNDERPAITLPPPRGPVFSAFPVPQVVNPQQNGAPASPVVQPQIVVPSDTPGVSPQPVLSPGGAQPSVPFGGTPRPGMVVPAPPQPGQQPINPAARPPEGQ